MKIRTKRFTSIAIIGNGFDLAHGYNTRYDHFTDSVNESFFSEYKEYLCTYNGDFKSDEWNSFEYQVAKLTAALYNKSITDNGFNDNLIKEFNIIFQRISEKLIDYLKTETIRVSFREIPSIRKHLNKSTVGLNFNYTNIAENYPCFIIYPHGSIHENEIVLGYDPLDAFCLATYENRKWLKHFCRDRLDFKRHILEKLFSSAFVDEALFKEIFLEYDYVLSQENSNKGLEEDDFNGLKHADFIKNYMNMRMNDVFAKKNICLKYIKKIVVIGHSIKADGEYLAQILDKCSNVRKIIIFMYEGEKQEEWDLKAEFFKPYCTEIKKELY